MKKIALTLMSAALVCGIAFLSGCGKKEAKAEGAAAKKTLLMVTEATFPPYEYFENGKITGIDVDIVSEVVKNLGYELKIQDTKFDSVILSVQTGKADIGASGITVTEDRKKQINFTIPYVTAAQVIIVPVKSDIKNAEDLKGKKLGVQQGTTGDIYVKEHYEGEPDRFDNAALAAAALRAGKLDAVVADNEPSKAIVKQYPNELKILPEALTSEEYAYAISKDNPELLKGFNRELLKMRESGKLQAILDKYLKE